METKPANGIKILCVEDEHFISELYARALRRAGYDVTTLLSGEDGLRSALKDDYDIILLDLMIPGITGFEVLRELRAKAPNLKAKILITTNLDQEDESREEIEKMADGYLIKAEFTPRQLVEIIDNVASGNDIAPQPTET
ncbi:response regulator [Candidatus Saccharibacteria bacterium]|nr:response regulator [Candidatus Saccharibacteria bacterium]MCB9817068.1 response regulator [Candidatus Nomurabacteria bacterium]HPD99041.1 response regulator [Candidatus Saccharibacteria bacterium]